MKLANLKNLAEANIEKNGEFSLKIGQAQMAMYKDLKKYGYKDEDELDPILDKHPHITLNNYIIKFS